MTISIVDIKILIVNILLGMGVLKLTTNIESKDSINVRDVQEVIDLVSRLDIEQKKMVLAALRGAVLIADIDSKKEGGIA